MNKIFVFDESLAVKYGVNEAIMISNMQFWIQKNKANKTHFYDNHYWTYNSVNAFIELFPFWTEKQIRSILEKLQEKGVLIKGNYNKNKYDKTSWYAFADEDLFLNNNTKSSEPSRKFDLPKQANQFAQNGVHPFAQMGRPIPDINTDINTDNNTNKSTNIDLFGNETKSDKADKNKKIKLGEFKNVNLTLEQIKKLIDIYGFAFEDGVEILSANLEAKGDRYKNHYAVMGRHNWVYGEVQKHPEYANNHKVTFIEDPTQDGGLRRQTAWEYYNEKYGWEK